MPLQIVTAADENYLPYLACHLISLGRFASPGKSMEVTIIHRGIPARSQSQLEELLPRHHRTRWIEPLPRLLRRIGAPPNFASCSPHYFRLLMPFVLPDCLRAIYLDADTLVLGDLLPLWETDLAGNTVAAVRDYIPRMCEAVANWEELQLNPDAPYFNSGVLLIDLVAWRAAEVSQRVLIICEKHSDQLLAQQKWPQYDQYGLNVTLTGRWKELERVWNYGTDLPPSDARIVHYIGNGKVGLPTCHPHFGRLFFSMLSHTPYRSWLPQPAAG